MHELVFHLAAVWITLLIGVCIGLLVRNSSASVRILLVDLIGLLAVAVLLLDSGAERVTFFIDAALALALLSFLGTLVAARFRVWGRIFGDR